MIPFLSKLFLKAPEPAKPQEPPHVHSFELIAKTIAEPQPFQKKLTVNNYLPKEIFLGTTTYLWECAECGQLRKEELLGSEEPTLPNLLVKVNEQGPIKIVRDGKTYLVGPLEEPRRTGTLPVR